MEQTCVCVSVKKYYSPGKETGFKGTSQTPPPAVTKFVQIQHELDQVHFTGNEKWQVLKSEV